MTFVLVDYKGGSAFSGCAHLPHVTGMVTDLDAHLTQRALASLSAELARRERVLATAGAKDIEHYAERGDLQSRYRPLPRLVIVIDAPDAGQISRANPGRGYVQLGHASLVPFHAVQEIRPPGTPKTS
jgi:DNA segregation ATPase FtsK/SpoIIIE-like protein